MTRALSAGASRLTQRHRLQFAVGGEHHVGARELQQRHRDAVAVRHRRLLDRPPARVRPQPPRDLSRKAGVRRHAEADPVEDGPQRLRLAAPSAILAAPTFEDFWITCATVSAPCGCASWIVRLPIVSWPGAVWMTLSGFTVPASSAAAAVNGFSVEPGSKRSVTARLRVRRGSSLSAVVAGCRTAGSPSPASRRSPRRAPRCRRPAPGVSSRRPSARGRRDTGCARRWRARIVRPSCGVLYALDVLDDAAQPVLDHAAAAGLAGERRPRRRARAPPGPGRPRP